MKRSRFSNEQIIDILKEHQARLSATELCRRYGVSDATLEPKMSSLSRLVRARLASLGLVAALGFILLVSLVASTAIEALGGLINSYLPFEAAILSTVSGLVSFILIALLFGAIYKVLPDRTLKWCDAAIGALVTSFLLALGKSLIGWYIATSAVASSYDAAGALIVVLWGCITLQKSFCSERR